MMKKETENKTPEILALLIELNQLEAAGDRTTEDTEVSRRVEEIREELPDTIFAHHRNITRMTRGRRSVAPLMGNSCGNCFLSIPTGDRHSAKAMEAIVFCHQCSVILHPENLKLESSHV